MIKILSFVLSMILFFLCLFGCDKNEIGGNDTESTVMQSTEKKQDEKYYIVSSEWMNLCFSQKDFTEAEAKNIAEEALLVMSDIRNYLDLNYTLDEALGSVCYFDSSYKNANGESRSMCFTNEKIIYCISLDGFVHEYVHLISANNADLVYLPQDLFIEGLAEYVSLNFYGSVATQNYVFFKERAIQKSSSQAEDRLLCELLAKKELECNASNYTKAFVAMLYKNYDASQINKNADYYKYCVGYVFADYCINRIMDLESFIDVYADSVTLTDVCGKNFDSLVAEACEYNMALFYKE